jgi:hypothetical protein
MSRFDDFLKLLLGLLVTQAVRDRLKVSANLEHLLSKESGHLNLKVLDGFWTEMFPYVVLLLFLRNTHASILWDRWLKRDANKKLRQSGRTAMVFEFLVTIATFVVAPLAAVHVLTGEKDQLPKFFWVVVVSLYAVFLFHWLLDLWLVLKAENADADEPVEYAIINWFRLDMLAFVALAFWVAAGTDARLSLTAISALIFLTVVIDYWANRKFYFPSSDVEF